MNTLIDLELSKHGISLYKYASETGATLYGFEIASNDKQVLITSQGYADQATAYRFLLEVLELPVKDVPLETMAYIEKAACFLEEDSVFAPAHQMLQEVVKKIISEIAGDAIVMFLPTSKAHIRIDWRNGQSGYSYLIHPSVIFFSINPIEVISEGFLASFSKAVSI